MGAIVLVVAFFAAVVPAGAAPLSGKALVEKMHAALEPARTSTRKLTIVVKAVAPETESTEWTAGQARKKLPDGARILTVVLAPESVKGMALLVQQQEKGPDRQWVYVPAIRRVRELVPVESHESFLSTDFTYADLGFVRRDASYKVLGSETRDGVRTSKIEAVPRDQWYYSRIDTWIASDSSLPIRREFHDPAGLLRKVETWGQVTRVDGTSLPLLVRMEDVRQGGSTDLRVGDVVWDREPPDDLFEPRNLPKAAASPVWNASAIR